MLNYFNIELRSGSGKSSSTGSPPVSLTDGTVILLPTDRHQREKVRAGWPNRQVCTFPDFLHRLNDTKALDLLPEAHQRMVMAHVVRDLAKRKKLKTFAGLAEQPGFLKALFAELSELSGLGIEPADFAIAIRQLADPPRPKDADVALIYDAYRSTLAKHHWRDRAVEYADALALWKTRFRKAFPNCQSVSIEEFVEFSPPQIAILQKLRQAGVELRIRLPLADDSERSELWQVAENTAAQLVDITPERVEIDDDQKVPRPAGIDHVLNHIFCPDDAKSDDAAGLHLIEAPGVVGEVKLVMRKIKTLLLNGVAAGDILVSMRDMSLYADLLREFASEYEVPIDLESTTPLARVPAVAALLKAASLPETDWPFAGTAALLRSSYLHPSWPEVAADPEIALDTELLLRWRGEPRGRVAYLQSVTAQARDLEPALEDEAAASSHRRYLQQLAERCLPFLTRFLSAWDARPTEATLHDYIRWLQSLADDLGFTNSATGRDADGLTRFFAELGTWADRDQMLHPRPPKLTTAEFLRLAEWIADANGLPRTPSEPDRVRIVPAELAAGLTYQHLFLMGLSEGRFPQLNTGPRIYDEQERRDFHGVGIAWSVGENRLSSEMLMFLRLVAGANHSVTLSYPAVDERGQALLSATFLKNVRDLFVADALPTLRREMLIEGLDTDPPLSPTEHRWRYSRTSEGSGQLSADLVDHLRTAKVMAQSRFESKDHGRFDGLLTAAACRSKIAAQFDPSAAYSATALENYVACPFKFFVGSVLKLQALPEPGAEIDARMRGAAFHRAVARFHRAHTTPRADIIVQLANEVFNAVTEYRQRSFSPITQALWDLEHQRLRRHTTRYGDHWTKFRDKYDGPIPIHTEVDFGPGQANSALVVTSDNLEIRIRGRIDRIDVVDLEDGGQGFWIIDYKTGRSSNYSGPAIDRFTALQMSLYAYAASEQVADCRARRPLGLAYWFPTRGAKVVKRWPSENDWLAMRDRIKAVLIEIVGRIRAGEFPLHPNNPDNCTATCDFGQMCRIAQSRGIEKNWMLSLPVVEGADESD